MSDITLSKGVRQNLLSLQNTASLLSKTQERLSTGKKVNSALDNPVNFFTASSLQARSKDLGRLLDSISNAIQTVQMADKGITSITKLIEAAQAQARQALASSVPAASGELEIAGNVAIAADQAATTASTGVNWGTLADLSALEDETVTLTVNGQTFEHVFTDANTGQPTDFRDFLAANGLTTTIDGSNNLVITAADASTTFSLSFSNPSVGTALGLSENSWSPTNADFGGETLSIQIGSGAAVDITLTTREALLEELNAIDGITASFVNDELVIDSESTQNVTIGGDGAAVLGLTAGTHEPTVTVTSPSDTRATAQAAYNQLLTQITQMARDAHYHGINLLDGDNLTVQFNEDGSSSLTIQAVDFTASGLGLTEQTGDAFQTNAGIQAAIAQLDSATLTLRSQAAAFGSNLSVIQARQDFTNNMINVLQIGADNLVIADTNEEGANMLALNTRQQLATTALSLAAQADQNVLRLF